MFMDSSSVLPDVTIYPPSLKLCCFPIRGSIGIHYMGIEPSVANVAQPAFRTYGLLLCAKFIHLAQQATNLANQTQAAATLQPSYFLPPPLSSSSHRHAGPHPFPDSSPRTEWEAGRSAPARRAAAGRLGREGFACSEGGEAL
jgi:hypothetical protein